MSDDARCPYCNLEHDELDPCDRPRCTGCAVERTGVRCVLCSLSPACPECGAAAERRCTRPSGHVLSPRFGNAIHAGRLQRVDLDVLARYPAGVLAALNADADDADADALAGWRRNLRAAVRRGVAEEHPALPRARRLLGHAELLLAPLHRHAVLDQDGEAA